MTTSAASTELQHPQSQPREWSHWLIWPCAGLLAGSITALAGGAALSVELLSSLGYTSVIEAAFSVFVAGLYFASFMALLTVPFGFIGGLLGAVSWSLVRRWRSGIRGYLLSGALGAAVLCGALMLDGVVFDTRETVFPTTTEPAGTIITVTTSVMLSLSAALAIWLSDTRPRRPAHLSPATVPVAETLASTLPAVRVYRQHTRSHWLWWPVAGAVGGYILGTLFSSLNNPTSRFLGPQHAAIDLDSLPLELISMLLTGLTSMVVVGACAGGLAAGLWELLRRYTPELFGQIVGGIGGTALLSLALAVFHPQPRTTTLGSLAITPEEPAWIALVKVILAATLGALATVAITRRQRTIAARVALLQERDSEAHESRCIRCDQPRFTVAS